MGNKFLHMVIPWDKEIENILERLVRDRVAYSRNTRLGTDFFRRYPEFNDEHMKMIDVVTTNYRKQKSETIFVLRPGVVIVPKNKKFSFHKIF